MNNIFSKRLIALADMIEPSKTVYDVGCDHAYLDIYLTLNKRNDCYAIDIHKFVVKKAIENVKSFNLDIPVLLNDGLNNLNIKNNSVIVIAGMGTRTILKILNEHPVDEVIIQSNDDLQVLRKTMSDWNYKITDEKIIYENNYFYILIKFKSGESQYNNNELLLGPVLMNSFNQTYNDYLNYLIKKYDKMLSDIPNEFYNKKIKIIKNKEIVVKYLSKLKMT